jgi:hypothetical protein
VFSACSEIAPRYSDHTLPDGLALFRPALLAERWWECSRIEKKESSRSGIREKVSHWNNLTG